jgi:hypothetical protein
MRRTDFSLVRFLTQILVTSLLVFAAKAVTPAARQLNVPDLSGTWRLNSELSDDAKAKLDTALQPVSQRRTGEHVPDNDVQQTRRRMELLVQASETLTIKQAEKELTIAEGHARERKIYTDGRSFQRLDQNGNMTTMRARWQTGKLMIDTRLADGGRYSETYEAVPDKRQLIVTVSSSDRRLKQPLVIRRVYDLEQVASE